MSGSRRGTKPARGVRTPRDETLGSSFASSPDIRRRMQGQRMRDTAPEVAVRRLLHGRGFRYRVDREPLKGMRRRADLVFGPAKVAVYIDGCFWHACPQHSSPRTTVNSDYWAAKMARNRHRDADTDRRLADAGWAVVRAWEHESPEVVAERVAQAVLARSEQRT